MKRRPWCVGEKSSEKSNYVTVISLVMKSSQMEMELKYINRQADNDSIVNHRWTKDHRGDKGHHGIQGRLTSGLAMYILVGKPQIKY